MVSDDNELIANTLRNDLTAFDELMQRYEKLVYKIAYGFGRNRENALDISQNVFLKAYQKLAAYNKTGSFKSWLAKIAYNEGVNWVRSNKRFEQNSPLEDMHEQVAAKFITRDDETLAKENKSELIHCLYKLNTRYRLAVVLRYFEEMPIRQIAETLSCSEGVVKNMLFRSLRKLKNNLQTQN